MNLKKLERYLRVNLMGPGPSSYKKNYLPGRGLTKVGKHWPTPLQHHHFAALCCAGHISARILNFRLVKIWVPGFATIHEQPLPLLTGGMCQDALWKRDGKQWNYSYVQYKVVTSLRGRTPHTAMRVLVALRTLNVALLIEAASDLGNNSKLVLEKTVRRTIHRRGVRERKWGHSNIDLWVAVMN
jgi:hypothetical protein